MAKSGKPTWDDEDDDKTPYGVSGEALPDVPDVIPPVIERRRPKEEEIYDDDEPIVVKPKNPFEVAEEEQQRSGKKKKKKRKLPKDIAMPDDDDTRRAKEDERYEWMITGALFGVGLLFTIMGSIGVSRKEGNEELNAFIIVLCVTIGLVFVVPLMMIALIVGGSIFGIEYGTPLSAARNLTGIITFTSGLDWMFEWIGIPWMGYLIAMLIMYSLFMTRFQLDFQELIITIVAIRVIMTLFLYGTLFLAFVLSGAKPKNKQQTYLTEPASVMVGTWARAA